MSTVALIIAGFAGGFVGSQVGSGNLLTLPPLLMLGLPLPVAVGTNALSGWLINVVASIRYRREGLVQVRRLLPFALAAGLGAALGAHLLFALDVKTIEATCAAAVVLLALLVVVTPRDRIESAANFEWTPVQAVIALPAAFLLGVYGGVVAVGLSTITIVVLLAAGKPRASSVATAATLSALLLTVASASYVLQQKILYSHAVPLAVSSIAGAWIGARIFVAHGEKYFRPLLIVAVLVLVVRLGVGSG